MNLRSLQENVTEATQALDNVAEFIQNKTGDTSVFSTVRPINYGDILNRIDFSGDTPTFAQVTVYKTQSKSPATPVGGTVDLILGVVEAPEGWSLKPPGTKDVWASTALWYDNEIQDQGWSAPYMVTGINGVAGEKGEQGEAGVSYRTVNVYTTTDSPENNPGQPRGGYWNIKTNEVSVPVSDKTYWYLNTDDEPYPKTYKWMSTVTFGPTGDPISNWSIPFRITGEDGKDGADGRVIEFIYRQLPNYDAYIKLRQFLNIKENNLPSINESDYIPEVNDNLEIDTNWTDRPVGISSDMQIEVVCSRIRKNIESPWEPWSQCAIWSKWGEDGMDGDGIEYIYLITPSEINGIPTTSGHVKDTMVPAYDINDSRYQQDEFCFNDDHGFIGYDWTDEPRDVGPGKPMEWVMIRKQKDGKWQSFSDPALWATYSEDGVSYITSFVFKRGSIDNPPTRPEGGDYADPKPSDKTWSDTVPSENSELPVWMSTRIFCSVAEYGDNDWSEPKMFADTPDFQVEYSADPNVTGDQITPYTGDEASWRALQPFVWGDDSEITDPIWMITSTRHGGKWSDWTLSKIKGEKGEKGDDGTSVNIQHKVKTKQELLNEWTDYLVGGAFFTSTAGLNGGEGVYVEDEGLLYVYSGGYYPGEDINFDLYWTAIHIKGEPGDSAYLYIRFTDGTDDSAKLYENEPKKYIGVKYSSEKITDSAILNSYNTYMWSPWKGEDGWGQEQIFLATTTKFNPETKHLPLPSSNEQIVDYCPAHGYGSDAYPSDKWSDTPVSVSEEYPFCWVVTRKSQGGVFGEWKGVDGSAALYSRYSYDGVSSVFIDLSNDLAVIPMEDGKIDPDFKDEVKTTVRVFVGDEQIPESDFIVEGNYVTIVGDTVTLDLSKLTSSIKEIPLKVSLKNSSYNNTINWHILQTEVAYELEPETYSIKRYVVGDKIGYLEKDSLGVDIWKWSDNKWVASNIPVFANVLFLDGTADTLSTSDGRITVSKNGHATVNLSGLKDVVGLKIYIVQQNTSGEYLSGGVQLSFENITIVADGTPGQDGEPGQDGKDAGRTVFVFTLAESDTTDVGIPSGGKLNISSNTLSNVTGSIVNYVWTTSTPTKTSDRQYIWQSNAYFDGNGDLIGDWSSPICITGAKGQDGADGTNIEFIYRLLPNKDSFALLKTSLVNKPLENTDTEIVPSSKGDGVSDKDWTDEPSGISEDFKIEVMCSRKAEMVDGKFTGWNDWSSPSYWSMWGEEGKDGPGLEYIFCITASDANSDTLWNEVKSYENYVNYQEDDFKPQDYNTNSDWTDEPKDVSEDKPLEWVSSRKKVNGVWGQYSKPKVWGKYSKDGKDGENGKDGVAFKTSYVFKRHTPTSSKPSPDAPQGGDWSTNPSGWSDSIPTTGTGPIWMSYRMFREDNVIVDETWSTPIMMVDSHDFEVIYGIKEALATGLPSLPIHDGLENHNGWYDDAVEDIDFYYMATASCDNGVWSNWTITKIKGEDGQQGPKGDKGDPGKSVSIKGNFNTEDDLRTAWDKWVNEQGSTSGFVGGNLTIGDGYLVQDTGDLWVFDGDGTTFTDAWVNVGKIQGEPGKSMYMSVRYSNNADGSSMLDEGKYGKYIGIAITDHELTETEKSDYTTFAPWQKWSGDDGWGWEQMFAATYDYSAPYILSSEITLSESELINKYSYSDKPIDANDSDHQYIWYWTRKTNSSWQGASTEDNKVYAALYTRWAKDGEQGPQGPAGNDGKDGQDGINGSDGKDGTDGNGIVSITKQFAVNNDPKNHPTDNWAEDMPSTSSENRYLWCEEITTYTKSDPVTIHYIVAVHGEPGANGTGNDAPIIYPAGVWDEEKTYTATPEKVPYVFYAGDEDNDEGYYVARTVSETTTAQLGIPPWEDEFWNPMESFEAIYADIGVFNQALVGKWVFHGDYMFSQEGVWGPNDAYGNPGDAASYTDVINAGESPKVCISEGTWTPNIYFNSVTGDFHGRKGSLSEIAISNGNITFDSDSFRMETDGKRTVTIYNGELVSDSPFGTTFVGSGKYESTVTTSMYMPQNSSSSVVNHSISISTNFLGANSSLSIGTFTATLPSVEWSTSSNTSSISAVTSLNGTAKLYYGETLLGTLTTTNSPNSNFSWDLSELNKYIDLKQNPGVYTIIVTIGNTFKANSTTEFGSFIVSKDLTFNWEYDHSAETIIGSNGILSSNENGFTYMGNVFKTIQNAYGLKIDTSGIKYTKDAGKTWSSLI